jgi:hypothetical protein
MQTLRRRVGAIARASGVEGSPLDTKRQFDAMIKVEPAHALRSRSVQLDAVHIVFVAIDEGPKGPVALGPATGEHAESRGWIEGLPLRAGNERRNAALDRRDPARRFRVTT